MNNILHKIEKWKREIESDKAEKSELEGSRKEKMRQMEEKFGAKSIEAAKKKLISMQKEHKKISLEIEKNFNQLKDIMNE
jgi:hypothetical protein